MFQTYDSHSDPGLHPPRLAALRQTLAARDLNGMLVPRADAHQGEYVAAHDARLAWLTGFSGSAGFCIVTPDRAGVFIDGRYRVQVKAEVDPAHFTPVPWPETRPADWLRESLPEGGRIGYDPWLHTRREIRDLEIGLTGSGIALIAMETNPIDAIWSDQPAPPVGVVRLWPDQIAGQTAAEKRARIAQELRNSGQRAAVLTLPDSISWLLNIRGADVPRNPVVQAFAIIEDNGHVAIFANPAKFPPEVRAALGNEVSVLPSEALTPALTNLSGPVRVDPASAPDRVFTLIESMKTPIAEAADPVILPKATKNAAEIAGMRDAHLRDGAAVCELLCWLDARAHTLDSQPLTEIDVARQLEQFRRDRGALDISFDTIAATGPHAAIPHYHVSTASNLRILPGQVLLVDSGGQYDTGTTDITRTLPMGPVDPAVRRPYTRVLQGMIAVTRLQFPRGIAGCHIDALARAPLWAEGMDYDHGTGHGVGAGLSVHEGPVRIARISDIPLQPGMILSNEPGYYREGAFGIRIENLIVVEPRDSADGRAMLGFETLTFAPIDRRLIEPGLMSAEDIAWLDAYHAQVFDKLAPLVSAATRDWLFLATRPLASLS
ncbi:MULTISPECIES: aminopeptidase P family protein [unclassified Paracoccus (in: a-proteobacteria)]|uniref:aminopeptidase P family protein n=1 Tax=unclassified Paracoccus (in: a-proteobacteria) TaxID=2688777 RepID=UPI0012B23609|nr:MULTISPECIES: aminopeptidase P family protein [unclassified Paracoccus (in: a-proteobacteria)]UXU75165.1 aminopeptidase P family protein [Paracoccus sp. SMMA_5]UXU81067.1 aminopeptidase P family protein [Paracoccus sp. SMMA_5_TC]